ncbi:MAG: sensor histidine kinase [Proteobacteria bacterium]|nr:sensor histidine kinase [Pseudomonadota bacterium]
MCEYLPWLWSSDILPAFTFDMLRLMIAALRHSLLCLTALLVLCASATAADRDGLRPLLVGEEQRTLGDQIALLRDPGGLLTIDDVAAPSMQNRFVAQQHGVSLGFTRDVVWLRIPLQREADAPAQWRLEAGNAVIDDYRFYGPDGKGGQTLILRAGDRQPFAARPCRYRYPLFPVVLPDDQRRVFYLRVESTSSLMFSLTLWQPEAFRLAAQSELMAIGVAFGVIVSTLLMSFCGGVMIRDRRYLVFIASCLFLGQFLATALGFTAQFAFPNSPAIADALHNINVCLLPAVVLLFMQQALRTQAFFPRLNAWLKWAVLVCVASTLSIPLDQFRVVGPLMQLTVVLSIALFAWLSWQAYRAGRRRAICFFAGATGFMLPTLMPVLTAWGAIDGAGWIETSVIGAVLSYCLLVNMGLLLDVKSIYDERLRAIADARLNRSLVEQEKTLRDEQTRLFAFVAHELRNPLGFIVYGLSNLRVGLVDADEAVRQRIARLAKAARRMSELIDRSLRLQRLAGADFAADFDECSPGFPALEACAQIGAAHSGRTIEYVAADDLPAEITIDSELVTLALVNLLDNAIKYSPPDSPITLSVGCDAAHPGTVVYRVSDGGPGIAEADRQRLFGIFPRSAGKGSAGFGIGLSLVANVVRHHGGSADCISRPGAGATFELRLPIRQATAGQTS